MRSSRSSIMMLPSISILSLAAALFLGAAQAAESKKTPHPHHSKHCADPPVRKEWRRLSREEKLSYLKAVKCIMAKPPVTSAEDLPGARNHYDDFVGTHIIQTPEVHFVGIFYPFHRLLLHAWEKSLHQCGWEGLQPYWDWTLDAGTPGHFHASPLFDNVTGFGGDGAYVPGNLSAPQLPVNAPFDIIDREGGGCLESGPFAGLMSNLGPKDNISYNPHCIRRDFSPGSLTNLSGPASVATQLAQPDYGWFEKGTEPSTHAGGHLGVGGLYGVMSDVFASPGDPIFWLHHANVDRIWWSWQTRNLSARVLDMSGPLVQFDYNNTKGGNATLDNVIRIGTTVNITTTVREVMHIQRGILCYAYDTIY